MRKIILLMVFSTALYGLARAGDAEDAEAALALAAAKIKNQKDVTPKIITDIKPKEKEVKWGYRQPRGHTHTCANGHTWDHLSNPTHNCKICGLPQYIQDSRPMPVLINLADCPDGNCPLRSSR